jgi:hypothetical protein
LGERFKDKRAPGGGRAGEGVNIGAAGLFPNMLRPRPPLNNFSTHRERPY